MTAWLRAELLDEPTRGDFLRVLRDYAHSRIDYGNAQDAAAEAEAYRETLARQDELWPALRTAIEPIRLTPAAASLTATTNESIDLAATRKATRVAHVPPRVLGALVVFAGVSAVMVGYEKGRLRISSSLLFFLPALAISVILDLDSPRSGAIQVSQQPMLDLWTSIQPAERIPPH